MDAVLPTILILGPTAGGKTGLAIELALRVPGGGEIISADSMQVYRGMDIGTAKPTADQRRHVPHHLIDLVEPSDEGFTVDHWLHLALRAVDEIRERDRWPIVVGGTNLYAQALLEGMFDGPAPDESLRARLDACDQDDLRHRLEVADPAAAQRIHPNDRRRTIRALEVFELTGRPISSFQQQWGRQFVSDAGDARREVRIIGLEHAVPDINRRINARVRAMMELGFLDEVRRIWQRDPSRPSGGFGRQAAEALGYKQLLAHLRGEMSLEDAVEEIKIRTRRFAKQQRTWLRRFRVRDGSRWYDATGISAQDIAQQAHNWLLDRPETSASNASDDGTAPRPDRIRV